MLRNLNRWILVPLIFLLTALFLSTIFFFNSDINPNILSHNESVSNIIKKNNIISGKFKASNNYLGIISLRFNKENLSGNSLFKIKNILDDDWYHTATISAEQYSTLPFYSFGFPVIEKSKNQTYKFEIKLFSGNRGLSLSKQEPVFASVYAYPKEMLLGNLGLLKDFAQKKISYYSGTKDYWKVFLIYSLPLLLYLLYISIFHRYFKIKILKKLARPTIVIAIIAMMIDIFVIRKYADSTTIWLTLLWTAGVIAYRLDPRFSFGLVLVFLTTCPFLLVGNMDWIAEKSAIWTYMMLVVGTVQSIFEISPLLQKIVKSRLSQMIIKFLRLVFLTFDYLIINLLIFIGQSVASLLTFIFKKFPTTFYGWLIFIGKLIILIITIFIISVTSGFIIIKINNAIQIINHKKIRLSLNPVIDIVEPKLVYKSTKIVIYGRGFGWDEKKSQALIDGEKIHTSLWNDSKIIFPVPLHWKDGIHKIWIEKKIDWDGKKQTAKSEVFEIKILPVTEKFTEDDKLYLEQMKTWSPETKEINGYK